MKQALITAFTALALCASADAGFSGSISFSPEEISRHEAGQDLIINTASSCLQDEISLHQAFHKKFGVSPFYGDRSVFAKMSLAEKKKHLRSLKKDPALLSRMRPTSCVGLVLKCLGRGFIAAGQKDIWTKIYQFTKINDVDGLAMQHGLQNLGWKILYWNPDTRMNETVDQNEKRREPTNPTKFWGYHASYWSSVQKKDRYLYNKVDDIRLLVNFGEKVPALLKKIPFFLGTAHGGYHVFPGIFGNVIESHSMRALTDPKTLQQDFFNPLAGQGPSDGIYFSGLIAVPAKYLP